MNGDRLKKQTEMELQSQEGKLLLGANKSLSLSEIRKFLEIKTNLWAALKKLIWLGLTWASVYIIISCFV